MKTLIVVFFLFASFVSAMAVDAGFPPWIFGMSKAQVESFQEFGPYQDFPNGDNETLNGQFHGKQANVQFFFRSGRLHHIGIYLFEGRDVKQGVPVWVRAYEDLEKDYGKILAPGIKTGKSSEPLTSESLALGAGVLADISGESQAIPAEQPANMKVTLKFLSNVAAGKKGYYVVIFYSPKD